MNSLEQSVYWALAAFHYSIESNFNFKAIQGNNLIPLKDLDIIQWLRSSCRHSIVTNNKCPIVIGSFRVKFPATRLNSRWRYHSWPKLLYNVKWVCCEYVVVRELDLVFGPSSHYYLRRSILNQWSCKWLVLFPQGNQSIASSLT